MLVFFTVAMLQAAARARDRGRNVVATLPFDDDDEGLGDDDDLLDLGAANEESKLEEVSDGGFFSP